MVTPFTIVLTALAGALMLANTKRRPPRRQPLPPQDNPVLVVVDRQAAVFKLPECIVTLRVTMLDPTRFGVSVIVTALPEQDRRPYPKLSDGKDTGRLFASIAETAAYELEGTDQQQVNIEPESDGKAYGEFAMTKPVKDLLGVMTIFGDYFKLFANDMAAIV
jgi:hypothetical protein